MFGQHSYDYAARLTKGELTPYAAIDAKKAGHNRLIWTNERGFRHYRLIRTDVVTVDPTGRKVAIDTGGWATMTTRRAVGQGLAALAPNPKGEAYTFERRPNCRTYYRDPVGAILCHGIGGQWRKGDHAESTLYLRQPTGETAGVRYLAPFDQRIEFERDAFGSVILDSIVTDYHGGGKGLDGRAYTVEPYDYNRAAA